jgi:hypothetical protein
LTGSAGSISILKKIQNDVVFVKKKQKQKQKSMGCNRVFDRVFPGHRVNPPGQPGHTGSWLMQFFHQPGLVSAPDRPGPGSTLRAGPGFKTLHIRFYSL